MLFGDAVKILSIAQKPGRRRSLSPQSASPQPNAPWRHHPRRIERPAIRPVAASAAADSGLRLRTVYIGLRPRDGVITVIRRWRTFASCRRGARRRGKSEREAVARRLDRSPQLTGSTTRPGVPASDGAVRAQCGGAQRAEDRRRSEDRAGPVTERRTGVVRCRRRWRLGGSL